MIGNTHRKGYSGDKVWNWKGGVTPEDKRERLRFRREVQKKVFERDDYTCNECGERGSSIQVHHIKAWSDFPELRFEPDNCQTLCMACHYKITFSAELPKDRVWGHNLNKLGESRIIS